MIAVIKGDIIASRKLKDQEIWLTPLKELLTTWGNTPEVWDVFWGDLFQIEIANPEEALQKTFEIKALLKKIESKDRRTKSLVDARMTIGFGDKTYMGKKVSESNGPAFIYAAEKFDLLKKEKVNLAVKSPDPDFDREINLYLKLIGLFMDNWSIASAQLVSIILKHPGISQEEIGQRLNIKQNTVSGRRSRANVDVLLEVEKIFRKKLKALIE